MKLFKRELWPRIRPVYGVEKMFNTELFLRLKTMGVVWRQVDVSHFSRKGGKSTGDSWRVIWRMVREIWDLKVAKKYPPLLPIAGVQSDYSANNSRILD